MVCLLVLAAMIYFSPHRLCYDESNHLGLTQLVRQIGWRNALLSPEDKSAAGPLYSAIQLLLAPLTRLQAPAIRWVNLFCLILVMLILAKQVFGAPLRKEWAGAASILSVPFLWPASGMALTELPALVMFTAFVFLQSRLLESQSEVSLRSMSSAAVAGLCLGLSILGRQPFLLAVPVVLVMVFFAPKKWPLLLVCVAVALSLCVWLFVLWGGLVPQCYRQVAHSPLNPAYGVLALSYAGAATLFLNPSWMRTKGLGVLVGCAFVGIAAAVLSRDYEQPPAKSLLMKIFGDRAAMIVGFLVGVGIAMLGVIWGWHLVNRIVEKRGQPAQLFLLLTLLALVSTPIAMTAAFSSRYIVGLLGVLYLVVGRFNEVSIWWHIRLVIGSSIGVATLWTYYHQ